MDAEFGADKTLVTSFCALSGHKRETIRGLPFRDLNFLKMNYRPKNFQRIDTYLVYGRYPGGEEPVRAQAAHVEHDDDVQHDTVPAVEEPGVHWPSGDGSYLLDLSDAASVRPH